MKLVFKCRSCGQKNRSDSERAKSARCGKCGLPMGITDQMVKSAIAAYWLTKMAEDAQKEKAKAFEQLFGNIGRGKNPWDP